MGTATETLDSRLELPLLPGGHATAMTQTSTENRQGYATEGELEITVLGSLLRKGLIEESRESPNGYVITAKGAQFLAQYSKIRASLSLSETNETIPLFVNHIGNRSLIKQHPFEYRRRATKDDVTIVLPVLNEQEGISAVVDDLQRHDYRNILVVDGHSTDLTAEIARSKNVPVIEQLGIGKTDAIKSAIEQVTTPYMLVMDGDSTYDAADIETLLDRAHEYDEVVGARNRANISRVRRFGNRVISNIFNSLFQTSITDVCSGMYLLNLRLAKNLEFRSKGFSVEAEILAQAVSRGQVTEVPINYRKRVGQSKLSPITSGMEIIGSILEEHKKIRHRSTSLSQSVKPDSGFLSPSATQQAIAVLTQLQNRTLVEPPRPTTPRIPLANPILDIEMEQAAIAALRNERFVLGESVHKFEEKFAEYCGTKFAVSTASGTAALTFSLMARGINGREALTSPASFVASANSIIHAGAKPKFADINLHTYTIDPNAIRKSINRKTGAILPVHLYGYPAAMKKICEIAAERDIMVVEDACQAHGGLFEGKRVGSFGDAGCFSFFPSKNMTVGGDGGMVITNDETIAEDVASLRDCGRVKGSKYTHNKIGYTSRLNTVQAAIGLVQLKRLDAWNEARRKIAAQYDNLLSDIDEIVTPPWGNTTTIPVYHMYVLRCKNRDGLRASLGEQGVETGIHYTAPIHLQPIYRAQFYYGEGDFPNSETLCQTALSIPMHPNLTEDEINRVSEGIHKFYRKYSTLSLTHEIPAQTTRGCQTSSAQTSE